MKLDSVYTTKTAAAELREPPFDDSYIRYLCLKHDVGQHLGRDWILTQGDIEILRKVLDR
jgi:hypothetical protein